ncbi:hypothetical protein [Thalassotalea ganghwensis]
MNYTTIYESTNYSFINHSLIFGLVFLVLPAFMFVYQWNKKKAGLEVDDSAMFFGVIGILVAISIVVASIVNTFLIRNMLQTEKVEILSGVIKNHEYISSRRGRSTFLVYAGNVSLRFETSNKYTGNGGYFERPFPEVNLMDDLNVRLTFTENDQTILKVEIENRDYKSLLRKRDQGYDFCRNACTWEYLIANKRLWRQ